MKKCNSLEEVRTEIDKIDDDIHQAASFKNSVDEVKAEDRVEFIKQKVRSKAIELDVSPNMISELFTKMIDEMVEDEISQFRNTTGF